MRVTKTTPPGPIELIDWLNHEGLLDLDWDFPEDGDLEAAGLDSTVVAQLVVAVEDCFGLELGPDDLTRANLATPKALAALLAARMA